MSEDDLAFQLLDMVQRKLPRHTIAIEMVMMVTSMMRNKEPQDEPLKLLYEEILAYKTGDEMSDHFKGYYDKVMDHLTEKYAELA